MKENLNKLPAILLGGAEPKYLSFKVPFFSTRTRFRQSRPKPKT